MYAASTVQIIADNINLDIGPKIRLCLTSFWTNIRTTIKYFAIAKLIGYQAFYCSAPAGFDGKTTSVSTALGDASTFFT